MNRADAALGDHLPSQIVGVPLTVDDGADARIYDHLGADYTRHGRTVKGGTVDIGAVTRSLDDGVLFGVQSTT
jgi:hypothetical protein